MHSFIDGALLTIGRASWFATVVIPMAWLICRMFDKAPRRFHCWVWRVAYLKIVVATLWVNPVILPVLPTEESASVSADFEKQAFPSVNDVIQRELAAAPTRYSVDATRLSRFPAWKYVSFFGWCVAVGWLLIGFSKEWLFSRYVRRVSYLCELEELLRRYRQDADEMGVRRLPHLVLTNELSTPALVGILRPVVAIPIDLVERLNSEEISLALRHELCHFVRLDLLWSLLPRLVSSVLCFHPFIWLANHRWKICQEAACDELVLQLKRGCRSREYAEMLLRVARMSSETNSLRVATIGIVGSNSSLRERILVMKRSTA